MIELRKFVSSVAAVEREPYLRPVILNVWTEDGSASALAVGLDRGDTAGSEFIDPETGFAVAVSQEIDEKIALHDVVFWVRDLDHLALAISPRNKYMQDMGDGQGGIVELVRA